MQLRKVNEVAKLLNTSERNIYHKIRDGHIPVVRIGRMTRIRTTDIEKLIGMSITQPKTELELEHREQIPLDNE